MTKNLIPRNPFLVPRSLPGSPVNCKTLPNGFNRGRNIKHLIPGLNPKNRTQN
jgi:hypothetical protein